MIASVRCESGRKSIWRVLIMKTGEVLKLAGLGLLFTLCTSGQSPRKEVPSAPTTQCITTEAEVKKETPTVQKAAAPKGRKSAAQKSMEVEEQTTMNRKSAAQRAMESEKDLPELPY